MLLGEEDEYDFLLLVAAIKNWRDRRAVPHGSGDRTIMRVPVKFLLPICTRKRASYFSSSVKAADLNDSEPVSAPYRLLVVCEATKECVRMCVCVCVCVCVSESGC